MLKKLFFCVVLLSTCSFSTPFEHLLKWAPFCLVNCCEYGENSPLYNLPRSYQGGIVSFLVINTALDISSSVFNALAHADPSKPQHEFDTAEMLAIMSTVFGALSIPAILFKPQGPFFASTMSALAWPFSLIAMIYSIKGWQANGSVWTAGYQSNAMLFSIMSCVWRTASIYAPTALLSLLKINIEPQT